ncbi:hypothetical protein BDP55DRAFT_242357 [Colletotrichum godetiae]|uniref:Uncharacterized protein n=1 Tax=Colletotrichum godetiae TaxID=1209918 RepID=A0AAJ0AEZ9_9PEZI|nr:uncharacterized protein BDP55DRAFT_242357 [Colletotrichum godetiae]KAK1672645.1 hypothetical protein BDP55DRAFT_242357 [Colletotrichum godetiae]
MSKSMSCAELREAPDKRRDLFESFCTYFLHRYGYTVFMIGSKNIVSVQVPTLQTRKPTRAHQVLTGNICTDT